MKSVLRCTFWVTSIFCISCATLPTYRVAQPWTRAIGSGHPVAPGAHFSIEVSGATSSLLGNEQLLANDLRETLGELLERRGFVIESKSGNYVAQLSYRTERKDKLRMSSATTSEGSIRSMSGSASGSGSAPGLGVAVAQTVSALAARSRVTATLSAQEQLSYTHVIVIEFRDRDGVLAWKGESTWDSRELDLRDQAVPAIQLILSSLPVVGAMRPAIPGIKSSHVLNYYKLFCERRMFSCPVLPYSIRFSNASQGRLVASGSVLPARIASPEAMAAFVDLIQTAESALPTGMTLGGASSARRDPAGVRMWRRDPASPTIWKRVTLGGQYALGPDKRAINVIVDLVGETDAYFVKKCRTVSDEEYGVFSARLTEWKQTLRDYYDVYAR